MPTLKLLVELRIYGTANGTECRLEHDHINPAGDLTGTVTIVQLILLRRNALLLIASVSGGNGTTIELLIQLQLPACYCDVQTPDPNRNNCAERAAGCSTYITLSTATTEATVSLEYTGTATSCVRRC
jgi:hypothetical protein